MLILGLDMATKTGWAVYDTKTQSVVESGVQDFSRRRGECGNGAMFMRVRTWLIHMMGFRPPIGLVAYERAHHRGGPATEILVGMTTRVQEIGTELGIPVTPVTTAEVRRQAKISCGELPGPKLAGKTASIRAAALELGRDPLDDNEADAIMVALAAAAEHAPGSKAA